MSKINLGTNDEGKSAALDVSRLLTTKLLVQGNSGAGKSWLLRKIMEGLYGEVQQIVLDIEDDFSTLREKFDFILAGSGGDVAVDPRTAEIFAHKILEYQANVVVNLYELKPRERILFVKNFLNAMVDAPKSLWHPCIVYLDEAHLFAPEAGKSESLEAVIDMASRGRKRGYCLVPATQRLAKLHKDVAAECQNKLMGLANMDIDRDRSAKELGFTDRKAILSLRDLVAGEFYAVGPAFTRGVNKIHVGKVKTTHLESGKISKKKHRPAASGKIEKLLAKFSDLPKEAAKEANTKLELLGQITALKRELHVTKQAKPSVSEKLIACPKLLALAEKRMRAEIAVELKRDTKGLFSWLKNVNGDAKNLTKEVKEQHSFTKISKNIRKSPSDVQLPKTYHVQEGLKGDFVYGKCERAILKFLLLRAGKAFSKVQLGTMTLYRPTSGGFNNSLSKLTQAGAILKRGTDYEINPASLSDIQSLLGQEANQHEGNALLAWLSKLGKCEREIFRVVKDHGENSPYSIDKVTLGELTGYRPTSGGFNNAISRLSTLGLITRSSAGVALNQEIVGL